MITRPVRERPEEQVRTMVREGLRRTGYDEVALTSLSSADFSGIDRVVADLVNEQEGTGSVSLSLPSLRVDAFTVGIATEIQKVRRTGLTFAPEGGSWRMRQVINKLITEEDLYAAVEGAYSQRLAAGEALLPHRPAHRERRRHARHRRAGARRRRDRPAAHEEPVVHGVARRLRAQGRTRRSSGSARTGSRSCTARSTLVRGALRGQRAAQLKWHDPEATFAEGIVSRGDRRIGTVIERVWRVGRHVPGVVASTSISRRWLDAMAAEGLDPDWFVTRQRTRRRGAAVGPHPRRSALRFPLERLAGSAPRARPARLPLDSVLRLRGVHRLRPRARRRVVGTAGGRQPGHRPGPLAVAREIPITLGKRPEHRRRRRFGGRCLMRGDTGFPVRVRYAKRGKVRWISHRDVARAFERALRIEQLPLAFTLGFSPRPKVSFGLALSTGYESDAEYLDLELAEPIESGVASRRDSRRRCPSVSRSTRSSPSKNGHPRCRKSSPRSPGKSK